MSEHPPAPKAANTDALGSEPNLQAAELADVKSALAFALRYCGRKRIDTAGEMMAQITAERLLEHLQASGFVVMKRPERASGPDMHYGPNVPGRPREAG